LRETRLTYRILDTGDVRHFHVMRRRANLFVTLAREDILTDHVDLGMSMLAGLGYLGVDHLAWVTLDDAMHVLFDRTALHRIR
jgi:hypothetical protein